MIDDISPIAMSTDDYELNISAEARRAQAQLHANHIQRVNRGLGDPGWRRTRRRVFWFWVGAGVTAAAIFVALWVGMAVAVGAKQP